MQHTSETVETTVLEVPARARYARVVRMTAANLATIAGMDVDAVDDVRMAAEEAFVYSCATGVEGVLRIEFALTEEGLSLDYALGNTPVVEDGTEPALVYAALILEAMCDECVISDEPQGCLHLFKRIGGSDDQRV